MVLLHCFLATSVANKNFNEVDTCLVNEPFITLHIILGSYSWYSEKWHDEHFQSWRLLLLQLLLFSRVWLFLTLCYYCVIAALFLLSFSRTPTSWPLYVWIDPPPSSSHQFSLSFYLFYFLGLFPYIFTELNFLSFLFCYCALTSQELFVMFWIFSFLQYNVLASWTSAFLFCGWYRS